MESSDQVRDFTDALEKALAWRDTDRSSDILQRAAQIVPITLVADSKRHATEFVANLREELGEQADVGLAMPGEALPDAPPATRFAVSGYVVIPERNGHSAADKVEFAATQLSAEVDHDELLDLLVISLPDDTAA